MALEDELDDVASGMEAGGAAASIFGDILAGLPAILGTAADSLKSFVGLTDAAKNGLSQGRDALGHLTGSAAPLNAAMGATASAIKSVGDMALSMANGPLPTAQQAMTAVGQTLAGGITSGAHTAAEALSGLGPEGAAAGAALEGVAAVAAATVGTLSTLAGIAVEVTEKLGLMTARFSALGGGEVMGAKTLAMVQQLGQSLPFTTAQIGGWAQGLQKAGIQGRELEAAVKAVAAAEALGEGGGAAAENMIKKLAEGGKGADTLVKSLQEGGGRSNKLLADMGLTAADLAKALGKTPAQFSKMKLGAAETAHAIEAALAVKGKGPLEEMGNSFPVLIAKVREGFFSLFEGLGPAVKPFMAAIKSLFGEFSRGGGVINAVKPILTAVLTTAFSWATKAVGAIHGIVTWLLASGKAGGFFSGAIGMLKSGWGALVSIFGLVKAALAPVIALLKAIFSNAMVLSGIKTIFTGIVGAIVAVIVIIAGLGAAIGVVVGFAAGIVGALAGMAAGAVSAAANFVAGLVDGITAGAGAVIAAVQGLASGALSAFTGALGIKSPSTIMLEHGEENIAGALGTGVDKGGPKVDKAMAKLGSGPVGKGKGFATQAAGGDRHFHYSGPLEHYPTFRDHMNRFLDETAQSGPEAETA